MSYDNWLKMWLWILGIVLAIMIGFLVYDTYQTRIWMNANNCQQTSQSREYMYYMTVISGNTTIVVPQIGTEYLYVCDKNQTIWWYGE